MWSCPNCKQTIPDLLSVKIDEKIIGENTMEVIAFTVKKLEFSKKVEEHNRNCKRFQRRWYLTENWFYLKIEAGLSSEVKGDWWGNKIIDITTKPQEKDYKYLECPMCEHKEYIR